MTGVETLASASPFPYILGAVVVSCLGVALLIYKQQASKQLNSQPATKRPAAETAQRLSLEDPNKPRVRLLYATQTGTAERFSKQLATELRKRYAESGTLVDVVDLENYKPAEQLPREKVVILCVATYGDGEPTDNSAEFFSWLGKAVDSPDNSSLLKDVSFAVFGLGNKQYEHFNAMGKRTYSSLEALGGKALLRRGDGDDDGCIDDDFEKWCSELYDVLAKHPELVGQAAAQQNGHTNGIAAAATVPAYDVEVLAPGSAQEVSAFPVTGTGKDHHSPHWATITGARELHSTLSDRSCVHVEVDISGAGIHYEHGDHVAIYPQNSRKAVEEAASLLGHSPDILIKLSIPPGVSGLDKPFPGPVTLRTALSFFTDLHSSPHKEALLALASFATDKGEADRLAHMASPQGKGEYAEFVAKPRRSLLEVLRAFPSAKPSLGAFFAVIAQRLQPRFYSISSSPKMYPGCAHVTCAVVRETTPLGRVHEGVASTWLKQQIGIGVGGKVPVFIRRSHFKLPSDPKVPVIMVGPGTGLAPFRGFLQERAAVKAAGGELGPGVLFFGCRNRAQDYIYEQELSGYLENGALSELHVAFSREGTTKDYVQHHMEREAATLWRLLGEEGGYLYVCGDAKHMAKDVHKTLLSIVQSAKQCTGGQAEAWVKSLQDQGRYQRDVW